MIFVTLFQCKKQTTTESNTLTITKQSLVLIDKTLSSKIDASIIKQHEGIILKTMGRDRFSQNGDQLAGYFIHANTLSNPPFISKTIDVEVPDTLNMGGRTKKNALNQYTSSIRSLQRVSINALREGINAFNEESTNQQTDLWAIFELMSGYFDNNASDDDRFVIIMSDMKESMKGEGRRDFHATPISSKAEAEAFAKTDAQWIQDNSRVNIDHLKGIKINILPPLTPTEKSNFQNLRYYWDALFSEMGIEEVSYF